VTKRFLTIAATLLLAAAGLGIAASPASAAPPGSVSCHIAAGKSACSTPFIAVTGAGILHIATTGTGSHLNTVTVTDIYTLVQVYGNGFTNIGDSSAWVGGLTNTYYGTLRCQCPGAVLWISNY
jgi:hypothetical protein